MLLQLKDVSKYFGDVQALKDINFTLQKGSIHGLLGPNGAGKSTLLKVLTGQILPDKGSLIWNDGKKLLSSQIGYLPEQIPLYQHMKLREYLEFVAKLYQVPRLKIKENVEREIESHQLQDFQHRIVGNLSKGLKQRLGLAMVQVYDASFLILDEPTSGLDPQSMSHIREKIISLRGQKTVLLSTHNLYETTLMCDEVTVLNFGQVVLSNELGQAKGAHGSEGRSVHSLEELFLGITKPQKEYRQGVQL
jgi:ABC-2 type transport system ATP-binding protein